MGTLETVLLILLVVDALALIGLVLIQQSKGADIGAAFGSGSAGAMFGPSGGASFLVRLTTILAIVFFVIAFALAYTAKQRADLLSGFDVSDAPVEVEEGGDIPDIGADSASDSTTVEGDEMPALNIPDVGDDMPAPVDAESVESSVESEEVTTDQ